jgi:hypothetical protein
MLTEGIFSLLCQNSSVSALIATRIYPLLLPNRATLPAATYQVISTTPLYDLQDRVNVTKLRLQIDVWASTYVAARSTAEAILSALDNFSGSLPNSTRVFGIQLRSSTDYFEHEALTYRVLMEFDIQFAHSS